MAIANAHANFTKQLRGADVDTFQTEVSSVLDSEPLKLELSAKEVHDYIISMCVAMQVSLFLFLFLRPNAVYSSIRALSKRPAH